MICDVRLSATTRTDGLSAKRFCNRSTAWPNDAGSTAYPRITDRPSPLGPESDRGGLSTVFRYSPAMRWASSGPFSKMRLPWRSISISPWPDTPSRNSRSFGATLSAVACRSTYGR